MRIVRAWSTPDAPVFTTARPKPLPCIALATRIRIGWQPAISGITFATAHRVRTTNKGLGGNPHAAHDESLQNDARNHGCDSTKLPCAIAAARSLCLASDHLCARSVFQRTALSFLLSANEAASAAVCVWFCRYMSFEKQELLLQAKAAGDSAALAFRE